MALRAGSDHQVAVAEAGEDGRFTLGLAPGGYELRGENTTGRPVPRATPVSVVVQPGRYAEIEIQFDSGIRGASTAR
ncbi:hypothetical protein [Micromonospora sp. NPDC048830]|uniref:hypothetical protein n=1 Tax=Micromonospora sp. NPDC048830 TaxID=3364257 RepID=UPI003723B450